MSELLLGFDVGTSSVKVGIFATDGRLVASTSASYPVSRPRPRHVEQSPDDYWLGTCHALRQAIAALPPDAGRIAAVGCCGQSPTLVLLDGAGRPVRPAILWQDTRASAEAAALAQSDGSAVDASSPVARLHWLATHEPDVLRQSTSVVGAKDYVVFYLTGRVGTDFWTGRGLFAHVPVPGQPLPPPHPSLDPSLLPACHFAHEVAGHVTAAAAEATGLPVGIPVAAGWSDGLAACLGTGALAEPGRGLDIAGTSEMIGLCAHERPPATRLLTAPIPGAAHWAVFGPTQSSGAALQWACRLTAMELEHAIALAGTVAPGADGLVFLPYLEGERAPIWDPDTRGLLLGLTSDHGPAHVIRAVLEGVACSVRHVLATAEHDTRTPADHVRTTGGGSRLELWTRIKANATARPFVSVPTADAGTLGSAMLGGTAAGLFPSLASAARTMVRLGPTVEPEPALTARYDTLYAHYLDLYPRLADRLHRAPR